MANRRRGTRFWTGYVFLGISALLTIGTLFLALTDRSLADLTNRSEDNAPPELTDAERVATETAGVTPTPAPLEPISNDVELTAQAAFVLDPDSDTVLYEHEEDTQLQPASTIKIFTAMVVLEHASPEEVIEVIEADEVDPVDESSMGLEAGDRVTIHDLLVGLMLSSGNDAASALSRTIGARIAGEDDESDDDRFISEMNRLAAELGLDDVNLKHAAGNDRDDQYVTARELAVATEALLERPSLATIVAMKTADVRVSGENPRILELENTNELLVHEDIIGVKTGTTNEAGQCLVIAEKNGESLRIAVLLGSEDRYGDARALLDLPEPAEPEDEGDEIDETV